MVPTTSTSGKDRAKSARAPIWKKISFWFAWAFVLVIVAAVVIGSTMPAAGACPLRSIQWWTWLAALVPVAIIVQQAFFVFLVRSSQVLDREVPTLWPWTAPPQAHSESEHNGEEHADGSTDLELAKSKRSAGPAEEKVTSAGRADTVDDMAQSLLPSLTASVAREFAPLALFIRFGVPALIILLVAITWVQALQLDGVVNATDPSHAAAWLGLAGAYVYSLLQLGRRAFTRDITAGVATWCGVTLVAGPILAVVLTKLGVDAFTGPSGGDGAAAAARDSSGLIHSLYFVAGFSPRYVIEGIFNSVRSKSPYFSASVAVARGVPLTDVRGIVPEIAERLGEEGIQDVAGLALCDAVKLLRNTAFDKRQVLGWIDEAILIITFPEQWQQLERLGITGAIDLAWCVTQRQSPDGHPEAPTVPNRAPLNRVASAVHMDAELMADIATRLAEDAQVGTIWAMYQASTDEV